MVLKSVFQPLRNDRNYSCKAFLLAYVPQVKKKINVLYSNVDLFWDTAVCNGTDKHKNRQTDRQINMVTLRLTRPGGKGI